MGALAALSLLATSAPRADHDRCRPPCVPTPSSTWRRTKGQRLSRGQWRYSDAAIVQVEHHAPGPDLRPSGRAEPDVRHRAARRCGRLQRLRVGVDPAAGLSKRDAHRAGCRSGGIALPSPSPNESVVSTPPDRRWCSRWSSTTTRRSGSMASCRSRSGRQAVSSSRASTRRIVSSLRATPCRASAFRSRCSARTGRCRTRPAISCGCDRRRSISTSEAVSVAWRDEGRQ